MTLHDSASGMPRPEYPRPDLRRAAWVNLNGTWEFASDDHDRGLAANWQEDGPFGERILVPFPFESTLSGIGEQGIRPVVWYRRTFATMRPRGGERLLLHFGAVDYEATVWLNGALLGRHRGGYTPFSFDVTDVVRDGDNTLVLRAFDPPSTDQPRGKQYWREEPTGIWYARTTGIWQTVWLEPVPPAHIRRLVLTPDLSDGSVQIEVEAEGDTGALSVEATAILFAEPVARVRGGPGEGRLLLRIPRARPWSPESPVLYDLRVSLLAGESPVDRVDSYFGLRKVAVEGRNILLNDRPYYQRLVLDQGYWPDGQYTAPSDDALRADILWARRFGYNGARKHQKIEDPRWLYWADRLGFLVWGEMPSPAIYRFSAEAIADLRDEWLQVLARDYNHPCLITWVPFNESWGIWGVRDRPEVQRAVRDVVALTRRHDPTRLVVDNSGWEHLDTDIADVHSYLRTAEQLHVWWPCFRAGQTYVYDSGHPFFAVGHHYGGQPVIFSEYGGMAMEGYPPPAGKPLQACGIDTRDRYLQRYHDLTRGILDMEDVCGFCFTQLVDVEGEVNGLLTYDRRPKVDPELIATFNQETPAAFPAREVEPVARC